MQSREKEALRAFLRLLSRVDCDVDTPLQPENSKETAILEALRRYVTPTRQHTPKLFRLRVQGDDRPGIVATMSECLAPLDIQYVYMRVRGERQFYGEFYFETDNTEILSEKLNRTSINVDFEIDSRATPSDCQFFDIHDYSGDGHWRCSFGGEYPMNDNHLCSPMYYRVWGPNEPRIVARLSQIFADHGVSIDSVSSGRFTPPETDRDYFMASFLFSADATWEHLELALHRLCEKEGWDDSSDRTYIHSWSCKKMKRISLYASPVDNVARAAQALASRNGVDLQLVEEIIESRACSGELGYRGVFRFPPSQEELLLKALKWEAPGDWNWDIHDGSDLKFTSGMPSPITTHY